MAALSFDLAGVPAFEQAIKQMEARVEAATRSTIVEGAHLLELGAKQRATRRPGPRVRTGTLRRSIHVTVVHAGPINYEAHVGPTTVYARILELGGRIVARRGPYLVFQINGQWVRVREVTIPAYPYLGPAFRRFVREAPALWTLAWQRAQGA